MICMAGKCSEAPLHNTQLNALSIMNALSEFFAQWSQDGLSPSLLNELGWLLAALAVAWLIVKLLSRHAAPASVLFGRRLIDGLLFPALALGLVYIGQLWLGRYQNLSLLKLAVPVLLSLVLIRLCARVLTAVFPQSPLAVLTERLISWLAWLIAVLWITDLLPVVVHEMEQVRFNFGKTRMDLRSLVEGVLSSGLVLVLTLWVSATIEHRVLAQTVSDLSMRKIATNVLRAVLLLVGLLLALSAVGVDLTALSVLGGALGVGLGLGLQKLAANYVSGFVVLVERSVRIGDIIRVDGMEGKVTDIKTRYTLLRDPSGRESIIPNDMLTTQRVDNFSLTQSAVAQLCPFTVAVDSDTVQVKQLLLDVANQLDIVLKDPEPLVFFSSFNQDGLVFTLHVWLADPFLGKLVVLSEVNAAVWEAFKQADIRLPPIKPTFVQWPNQP